MNNAAKCSPGSGIQGPQSEGIQEREAKSYRHGILLFTLELEDSLSSQPFFNSCKRLKYLAQGFLALIHLMEAGGESLPRLGTEMLERAHVSLPEHIW